MKISSTRSKTFLQGFTLTELIVTLVIISVLYGIGVPAFNTLMQRIYLSISAGELHNAVKLARAEAIKRNGKVDLIAINGNWKNGWIITSEDNQNIMTHGPLNRTLNISANFSNGRQHIVFYGAGRSRTDSNNNSPQFGHFHITAGENSRLIFVNFLGHSRLCNPASDKNCATDSSE